MDSLVNDFVAGEIEHAVWNAWHDQCPNMIVIEDKSTGSSLLQELQYERPHRVPRPVGFVPKADKLTRMHVQSDKIEAGHVLLPAPMSEVCSTSPETISSPVWNWTSKRPKSEAEAPFW